MTAKEAEKLGYKVIKASKFEVGLTKNGKGLRTWFAQEFNRKLPKLDNPVIQAAIRLQEWMEKEGLV